MLEKIVESLSSKVGELLADNAQNTVRLITDVKSTLDSLQRNINSLTAKASDVKEEIKNAELSGKKKRKREVEEWLVEVQIIDAEFCNSYSDSSRFLGGGRAAELNERVRELVEQSRHFDGLLLDVCGTRGEQLRTRGLVGKAFEQTLEIIQECLVTGDVRSIGIYGMGGAGKTTLAKHINNRLLERTQDCVFWVTVSQVFSITKLQDEIARLVGLDLSDEHDEDKRARRLYRALSLRKNVVLILDDLWKNIILGEVGVPSDGCNGCKLIITTRSLEVCRRMDCKKIIKVETLGSDEAWDLFSQTLGGAATLAAQVQEIAKCMVKVCDGLPLGIITLAGSMRGETAIHAWRNAREDVEKSIMEQEYDMNDKVFKVLKYSFDRLDPNHQRQGTSNGYTKLQLCFLYCSLYPEDYLISKEELIRKFRLEEFVDKRKSRKGQFDQGHSMLDKLVNVCLLESAQGGYGVKMHDLVRAMALKITEGKTLVAAGHSLMEIPNEEEWTKDVEKVSLMARDIKEIPTEMSPNCPNLSTLLLQKNDGLGFIPGSFFLQMRSLCILDLSETGIKELPNSLSDLESLKALLLGKCKHLKCVPYLGKLKALEELDLCGTAIKEVPQGMEEVDKLKCLSIVARWLKMLPTGLLLKFRYLQCLQLSFEIEAPVEDIKRLKQLEEFKGRVKDVCDFNLLIGSQQFKENGASYHIQVGKVSHGMPAGPRVDCKRVAVQVRNLKREGVIMVAQDVQHLELGGCEGLSNCLLDDFPRFNNPKSFESLSIWHCKGTGYFLTYEQFLKAKEELECQYLPLRTLERIALCELENFMGVIQKREIGSAVAASSPPSPAPPLFSSLRHLFICRCHKMKRLGLPASEFSNLETIVIKDCLGIEEIIEDEEGRGEGEARYINLPKLKLLKLCGLPSLKSICKATMMCSSIEEIYLLRCPKLKRLPLYFAADSNLHYSPPPALREIHIGELGGEWWRSLEWEHPSHPRLLEPFFRF